MGGGGGGGGGAPMKGGVFIMILHLWSHETQCLNIPTTNSLTLMGEVTGSINKGHVLDPGRIFCCFTLHYSHQNTLRV